MYSSDTSFIRLIALSQCYTALVDLIYSIIQYENCLRKGQTFISYDKKKDYKASILEMNDLMFRITVL